MRFLLTGVYDLQSARDDGENGLLYFLAVRDSDTSDKLRAAWALVREAQLAGWIKDSPGCRPWAWWQLDRPRDQRQRVGGIGDVFVTGKLERGIETDWVLPWMVEYYNGRNIRPTDRCCWNRDFVEGYFTSVAIDPRDPPTFESEAAYLERHDLFLKGERGRLAAEAFDPEVLTIDVVDDAPAA